MISTPYRWRGDRVLRIALVLSLVIHLVGGMLGFWTIFDAAKLFPALKTKPKDKEIVTISSAITLDRKAKPVPAARPAPPKAHPVPPVPPAPERVASVPEQPAVKQIEQLPAPSLERHELAKTVPKATAEPEKTIHQPTVTDVPSAAPHPPAPVKHVALSERNSPQSPLQRPSHFSPQELAKIDQDLAKTIAQARAADDPLRTPQHVIPAGPKQYRVQMQGLFGPLAHGEGYYKPIPGSGWRDSAYDYYYVTYEFTYPDGTYETGAVPWPIRFPKSADPFTHPWMDKVQMPGPPVGFVPPQNLGKALREYFPDTKFPD
jgi:hypothetical protein